MRGPSDQSEIKVVDLADMERNTEGWKVFESEILQFLTKLDFKDVKGGDETTPIFGRQIDACGGFEDLLFVIEAKFSSRQRQAPIENAINGITVNKSDLVRNSRRDPGYAKYRRFVHVIATKGIVVSDPDKERAKKHGIFLWDESLLGYYGRLFSYIGKYAVYNLLGELHIMPSKEELVRIPAIRQIVGRYPLYTFFIEPHKLLQFSFVARRGRGFENFYQRIISKDRIARIAREYIEQQKGIFPNNIIISIDAKSEFISIQSANELFEKGGPEIGVLQFPRTYASVRVIDGQHRLYAFSKTPQETDILVAAFDKLSVNEQLRFFVDINEEQKSVDSNLTWDLDGIIRPNELRGIISNAARKLNNLTPFYEKKTGKQKFRIYYPLLGEKQKGDLRMSGVCDSILKARLGGENLKTKSDVKNPMYSDSFSIHSNRVANALSAYFEAICEKLSEEHRDVVFRSDGVFSLLVHFYERILSANKGFPKREKLSDYADQIEKFLSSINIEALRKGLTSEAMKDVQTNQLVEFVGVALNDESLLAFVKSSEYNRRVDLVGQKIGDLLNKTLTRRASPNWMSDLVEEIVVKKANDRLQRKVPEDPRTEIFQFFTLGELKDILRLPRIWEIMRPTFVNVKGIGSPFRFNTDELFFGFVDLLIAYRNPPSHGTRIAIAKENLEMIEASLLKLEKILGISD